MKPDTEQIIEALRAGASDNEKIMDLAADRLEELQREHDEARAEVEHFVKLGHAAARARDEYRDEVKRVNKELENSTNHYNRLHDLLRADVERLKLERDEARAEMERLKADSERLTKELWEAKGWRHDWRPDWVRKDPSRLEIAAMIYANIGDHTIAEAITAADVLIAAAREGGK